MMMLGRLRPVEKINTSEMITLIKDLFKSNVVLPFKQRIWFTTARMRKPDSNTTRFFLYREIQFDSNPEAMSIHAIWSETSHWTELLLVFSITAPEKHEPEAQSLSANLFNDTAVMCRVAQTISQPNCVETPPILNPTKMLGCFRPAETIHTFELMSALVQGEQASKSAAFMKFVQRYNCHVRIDANNV